MKTVSLLAILMFTFGICAQSQKATRETIRRYKSAESIAKDALEKLNEGKLNESKLLIKKSIDEHPSEMVFDYLEVLLETQDFSNSLEIFEYCKKGIISFPDSIMASRIDGLKTLYASSKSSVLSLALYEAIMLFEKHGFYNGIKIVRDEIIETATDPQYISIHQFERSLLSGDYSTALSIAAHQPRRTNNGDLWYLRIVMIARVQLEMGEFVEAHETMKELKNLEWGVSVYPSMRPWYVLAETAARVGDAAEIRRAYTYIAKHFWEDNRNAKGYKMRTKDYYLFALGDIQLGKYSQALLYLDSIPMVKKYVVTEPVPKWMVYNLYGDAYKGLKQYAKAKDCYDISLFSNPHYSFAKAGLIDLESTIASETSRDKTPPVITITEPQSTRGLAVVANGRTIQVRGVATDPSGLRSVTINGKEAFFQNSGNFWGEIALTPGNNKILIKAIDAADNVGSISFDVTEQTEIEPVVVKEGKNYCLLIASQDYKDPTIVSLNNPIPDAIKLKLVLKNNYNFLDENIITLFNPTNNDIKRQLLELSNMLNPEDNVIIFYAGHGLWVEKEKKGYWFMVDAVRNDENTWFSNKTALDLISKIPARHTLLITDACFSGGVFKTRSFTKDASTTVQVLGEKISRVAITSGNDTEVPDESIFMKYLIKALSENTDKYLPAQKMFITRIIEAVINESKIEPRYGTLESAGHIGGDFIFTKN